MESSATGRAIVARLKLLEDLLAGLEAGDGHSRAEWRAWMLAARAAGPKSKTRSDLAKRVREAKRKWFPLRDLVVRNWQTIGAMEADVTKDTLVLVHGPLPKCARNREIHRPATYVTHLVECWTLNRRCVESARHELLAILDRQRQLAPLREIMDAIKRSVPADTLNRKLFNADSRMKAGVYRILKALDVPVQKLSLLVTPARFKSNESVREFTGAMQKENWIKRSSSGRWSRTRAGTKAMKAAE